MKRSMTPLVVVALELLVTHELHDMYKIPSRYRIRLHLPNTFLQVNNNSDICINRGEERTPVQRRATRLWDQREDPKRQEQQHYCMKHTKPNYCAVCEREISGQRKRSGLIHPCSSTKRPLHQWAVFHQCVHHKLRSTDWRFECFRVSEFWGGGVSRLPVQRLRDWVQAKRSLEMQVLTTLVAHVTGRDEQVE